MSDPLRAASRKLSWLLRHGAVESGLEMDAAGWSGVREVARISGLDRDTIAQVVATNDKRRLELRDGRIRASRGHSLGGTPVTCEALEASWTPVHVEEAVHGTTTSALGGIAEHGLTSQQRTHVHLAASADSTVGKRAQVSVLLVVSGSRLAELGASVFRSPNGVLLVRRVPVEAFVDLRPLSRRARKEEDRLRALFGWHA